MTKVVTIEGMSCNHCTASVKAALERLDGVTAVDVKLEDKTAKVQCGAGTTDEMITEAIDDIGFDVISIK